MKAKLLGIIVIGGLMLSMLATTAGAVSRVISEGATIPADVLKSTSVGLSASDASPSKEGAVVGTLKFVCPFH